MLLTVAFPGNQQGHDVTESLPWVSDQTLCVRHVTVPFFFPGPNSIWLHNFLPLPCCLVHCGGSPSGEGALDLVQLGPSVQMQREWEKGIVFVAKKNLQNKEQHLSL